MSQFVSRAFAPLFSFFFLLSFIFGSVFPSVSVFAAAAKAPTLLSPVPGSVISSSGSLTLQWSNEGALSYSVAFGSDTALPDYGWFPDVQGTNLTVKNIPIHGNILHIRLFSNFSFGSFANDFVLKTSSTTPKTPKLLSPKAGSALNSSTVSLQWSDVGALWYRVIFGSKPGYSNYGSYNKIQSTSLTVNNLPKNGKKIYVKIFAKFPSKSVSKKFYLKAAQPQPAQTAQISSALSSDSPSSSSSSSSPDLSSPPPPPSSPPVSDTTSSLSAVWANDGGDKVTRDEHRASANSNAVLNSVWNGNSISLFGAKNEVIGMNLILEANASGAKNVSVSFPKLTGPNGVSLVSQPVTGNQVFQWIDRNIELFYVRYLQIKGLSRLSYENYDERHIPKRFQRPFTGAGNGSGKWEDRPDHDKFYPDIAVPLELKPTFDIAANQNQSIWIDVTVPKNTPAGMYSGDVFITENGKTTKQIPVSLNVRNFTLPDTPSSKTMVVFSHSDLNQRYLAVDWPNAGTAEGDLAKKIRDRHYEIAHRHKISLIDDDATNGDAPSAEAAARLNGSLFTKANGYSGPGEGVGNNVYAIGLYGGWNWKGEGESGMRKHADNWVNWFDANSPQTEYFLYLADESSDYPQMQQWASWIANNPGVGKKLKSFATIPLPQSVGSVPALSIAASWFTVGIPSTWNNALNAVRANSSKRFFLYNGKRPANGSFATEDDGVALRELPWAQYKKNIDRWFFWQSTYYNDFQGGRGQTNVFQTAATFSGGTSFDSVLGETGWNHSNGDGVLFYPGTDKTFPGDSYNVAGPFASLRLKHWRRGIQDTDYLTLAAQKDPVAAKKILDTMVPKAFWDYGVSDPSDPSWIRSDISWSVNPDDWENARKELANIIERNF